MTQKTFTLEELISAISEAWDAGFNKSFSVGYKISHGGEDDEPSKAEYIKNKYGIEINIPMTREDFIKKHNLLDDLRGNND